MTHAHVDPGSGETDVERSDLSTAFGDSAADSLRGLLAPRRAPVRAVDDADVEPEPEISPPGEPSGEGAEVLDAAVAVDASGVAPPAEPSDRAVPADPAEVAPPPELAAEVPEMAPPVTVEPSDSAELIAPTDSTSADSLEEPVAAEPAEPAEPEQFAELPDAAVLPESAELSEPAEPPEPVEGLEPGEPADAPDLSDAELAEPAEPLRTDDPVAPESAVPTRGPSTRAASGRAVPSRGTSRTAPPQQRRPRPTRVKDRDDVDLLLLAVVGDGVSNGREIVELVRHRSDGAVEMPERRVYEELHRLRHNRLIADTGRGERARFVLTESGERILRARARRWQAYTRAMGQVLGSEPLTTIR